MALVRDITDFHARVMQALHNWDGGVPLDTEISLYSDEATALLRNWFTEVKDAESALILLDLLFISNAGYLDVEESLERYFYGKCMLATCSLIRGQASPSDWKSASWELASMSQSVIISDFVRGDFRHMGTLLGMVAVCEHAVQENRSLASTKWDCYTTWEASSGVNAQVWAMDTVLNSNIRDLLLNAPGIFHHLLKKEVIQAVGQSAVGAAVVTKIEQLLNEDEPLRFGEKVSTYAMNTELTQVYIPENEGRGRKFFNLVLDVIYEGDRGVHDTVEHSIAKVVFADCGYADGALDDIMTMYMSIEGRKVDPRVFAEAFGGDINNTER